MVDLWNPAHVTLGIDLLTAFLLGIVHGVTPDEHTWPITFSYAVGGYSTRRGLRAGLIFSAAFTVQQALATELAYLGLARWFTFPWAEAVIYLVIGFLMLVAGLFVIGRGVLPHLSLPRFLRRAGAHEQGSDDPVTPRPLRDLKPWMPAVHGFVAGWGFDAFAVSLYTVLAPAMPSAATAWLPGAAYGLGTLCIQAGAGAAFGLWSARRGLPPEAVRAIALLAASRTLTWGGGAFVLAGLVSLTFPGLADFGIATGLQIPNLHTIDLPLVLAILCVAGIGVTTLVSATYAWRRQVALLGIFAILFQAILFGWHHHDIGLAAQGTPAALRAADSGLPPAPIADADGCEICIALHHQAAAPAAFAAAPGGPRVAASVSAAATAIIGIAFLRAFDSRAPPRA